LKSLQILFICFKAAYQLSITHLWD